MTRVAFVTGGTRGIGRAITAELRRAGFAVAAGYAGNEAAAEACARETGAVPVKGNVSLFDDCRRAIAEVEAKLGPVEILVNNAGITRDAVLHRMTIEQWTEVIHVNLVSVFNMCRNVIEGMRERAFGRIVNIASINGQKGQVGQTNYSASKAGVIGFTKALALENAKKGITVNCVCPGYVDTEMVASVPPQVMQSILAQIPSGRLGRADEVASLVAWLASDAAAYTTGSVLSMNGGQYMV